MPKSLASLLPATPPALCIVDFIRARETVTLSSPKGVHTLPLKTPRLTPLPFSFTSYILLTYKIL